MQLHCTCAEEPRKPEGNTRTPADSPLADPPVRVSLQRCEELTLDAAMQGFRRRSLLRLLGRKSSVEEGPTYTPLPIC